MSCRRRVASHFSAQFSAVKRPIMQWIVAAPPCRSHSVWMYCKISSRWRSIASRKQEARISVLVRENRPDVRQDYADAVDAR